MSLLRDGKPISSTNSGDVKTAAANVLKLKSSRCAGSRASTTRSASGTVGDEPPLVGHRPTRRCSQLEAPGHDWQYEIDKEGVPVGSDTIVIPKNAPHPNTAMLFLDWMLAARELGGQPPYIGYPMMTTPGLRPYATLVKKYPWLKITIPEVAEGPALRHRLGRAEALEQRPVGQDQGVGAAGRDRTTDPRGRAACGAASGTRSSSRPASGCSRCSSSRSASSWRSRSRARTSSATRSTTGRSRAGLPARYSTVLATRSCRRSSTRWRSPPATTALCLLVGYPMAYVIARYGGRVRHLLVALLILPWFVDYLVRIYAWVALLGDNGLVNGVLHDLGMGGDPPIQFLEHLVGGDRRAGLQLLPVHDAADLRRGRAHGPGARRGRQGPLRHALADVPARHAAGDLAGRARRLRARLPAGARATSRTPSSSAGRTRR